MKQYWNGITNYIKTKINNGILKGANSLIQAAKDSARGFSQRKILLLLFIFGQENLNSIYPQETAKSLNSPFTHRDLSRNADLYSTMGSK
ncbi:MAG: transposase [Methanotrichaceae archaeon]|jgi:hypothetical protein